MYTIIVFFFKQKTAYEMRISDWSSDVCSSDLYQIIVGDPEKVATQMAAGIRRVREYRLDEKDSFYFNWSLQVPLEFQQPFQPTHEAMAALDLHHGRKPHELDADLRRAFSGIVAGNVKEDGMRRIEEHGPFQIHGDTENGRAHV